MNDTEVGIAIVVVAIVAFGGGLGLGTGMAPPMTPADEKAITRFKLVEQLVDVARDKKLDDKEKASLWDLAVDFIEHGDPIDNFSAAASFEPRTECEGETAAQR